MASPQRVYLKKHTKTTSRMVAAKKLHRYTSPMISGPSRIGSMENTGGAKTRVSVLQMNSTVPLKKKDNPTVTMMTVRTGSPISRSRKIRSVRTPRMNPMMSENRSDSRNGTPME
jgi:hypothetical protein